MPGEDLESLPRTLCEEQWNWIVITSPEAASVFLRGWKEAGKPNIEKIAAVGGATGEVLNSEGLEVDFQPSKATGRILVHEMPQPSGDGEKILYPASAKASNDIVDGLTKRGYIVKRINTYSTETAEWTLEERCMSKKIHIATFSSPSTVRGWTNNVKVDPSLPVACIGETSAEAAKSAGFVKVFHPGSPGIPGWVQAIQQAVGSHNS